MDFVGIDLHKTSSQICTLSEGGGLTERRIKTTRASLDEVFIGKPPARILVEASTESEWVARHLEALGHEVIVADPNFAPPGLADRAGATAPFGVEEPRRLAPATLR